MKTQNVNMIQIKYQKELFFEKQGATDTTFKEK